MGDIKFRSEEEKIQENAGSIFAGETSSENTNSYVGAIQQSVGYNEKADSYVGTIQQPTGYVGGFFGTTGNIEEQNTGSYVGGFISKQTQQSQNIGYENISTAEEYGSKKLPVKAGFWSKIKSFFFQKINSKQETKTEISAKGEKVLNEVHDFLFQEVSFKGFKNFLKNNKNQ